ncbi:hypothetical protein [Nocardioides sp. CER19]|uniref:hypothetical protein n=1 Tax=Nocardioides sp. CER19 TaxID=3038538 RepID=UPI00244B8DB6|nr:hypothetical protein [Nocardioides sp. CER19]MDH2414609.1 hypothetical protein [Nocardioides sp. CER19]
MTTLSLFDEPERLDPHAVRDLPPTVRPVTPGGLSLSVLAFAALVASPAIWQCLVRHTVPMHVMLERYVVIALGCLLVSEAARRLLRHAGAQEPAGGQAGEAVDATVTDTLVMPTAPGAPADPALALLAAEE